MRANFFDLNFLSSSYHRLSLVFFTKNFETFFIF